MNRRNFLSKLGLSASVASLVAVPRRAFSSETWASINSSNPPEFRKPPELAPVADEQRKALLRKLGGNTPVRDSGGVVSSAGRPSLYGRMTDKAKRAIFFARYEACQEGENYIYPQHLLLGIVREDRSLAGLLKDEYRRGSIRAKVEQVFPRYSVADPTRDPMLSPSMKLIIRTADSASSDGICDITHLLFGILSYDSKTTDVLEHFGIHAWMVSPYRHNDNPLEGLVGGHESLANEMAEIGIELPDDDEDDD